jgi:hypothetical protein
MSNVEITIDSPPFYSSRTGYKMCLRLTLDGNENAKHTYMSLSFGLMPNEYDAILVFPFRFKIIFCLYDLSGQQHHIIEVFKLDGKSNSLQRPQSEIIFTSAISRFVPLTIFEQDNNPYIHDDTMFIKVMIDFFEIPEAVLPYALNLNPGLTPQIQQSMVRKETEERQATTNNKTNQSMDMNLQQINTL